MATTIENTYIMMYPQYKDFPIELFDETLYNFGIIKIDMATVPVDKRPIYILFTVDTSISMEELCADGKSKMHHILNTFEHMIRFISQQTDANVTICVDTFNLKINHIIPDTRVTAENAEELIALVREIRPCDSTDIELALLNAQDKINRIHSSNAEGDQTQLFHVFLTDGEANHGQTNPDKLVKLIQTEISQNMFIGYGTTHNSKMLRTFGDTFTSKYVFIDHGENSGAVYGELMQRIMFPALDATILDTSAEECLTGIENGVSEIYNWKTNEWTTDVYIGSVDSGAELTFHIRTKNLETNNVYARIMGKIPGSSQMIGENINCLPDLVDDNGAIVDENSDIIEKYMFRQRTLELMFECSNFRERDCHNMKRKLSDFFKKMHNYMRTQNRLMDPFMRLLCEDIVTCYRTLGTSVGQMYSAARQGSQGQQTTFTPHYSDRVDVDTYDDHATSPFPNIPRRVNTCAYDDSIDVGSDEDEDSQADIPFPTSPPVLQRRLTTTCPQTPLQNRWVNSSNNDTVAAKPPLDEDDIENYVIISSSENVENRVYSTPGRLNTISALKHGSSASNN